MQENELENELEKTLSEMTAEAVKGTRYESPKPALKAVPKEPTLHEQFAHHEQLLRDIRARVNEARIKLQEEFERQLTMIRSGYERKLADLAVERDNELRKLTDSYHQKKIELEEMVRRLIND